MKVYTQHNQKRYIKTKTVNTFKRQIELPDGRIIKQKQLGNILPPPHMRAGKELRTYATKVIAYAYLEDVITAEEYHARFAAAITAVTELEIKTLLCDFPPRIFAPPPIHHLTDNLPVPNMPPPIWNFPKSKGTDLTHTVREEIRTILHRAYEEEMLTPVEFNERLWLAQKMIKPEKFATLTTDLPPHINTFNPQKYVKPQPNTRTRKRKKYTTVPKNFATLATATVAIVGAFTVDVEQIVEKLTPPPYR